MGDRERFLPPLFKLNRHRQLMIVFILISLLVFPSLPSAAYVDKGKSKHGEFEVERTVAIRPSYFGFSRGDIYEALLAHTGELKISKRKAKLKQTQEEPFFTKTKTLHPKEWWRDTGWVCEVKRELKQGIESANKPCVICSYIQKRPKRLYFFTEYIEQMQRGKPCKKCGYEIDRTPLRFAKVQVTDTITTYQHISNTNRISKVKGCDIKILQVVSPEEWNQKSYYIDEYERVRICKEHNIRKGERKPGKAAK